MVSRNYIRNQKIKKRIAKGLAIVASAAAIGGGIFGISKAVKGNTNSENKEKVVNVQKQPTLVRHDVIEKHVYHEKKVFVPVEKVVVQKETVVVHDSDLRGIFFHRRARPVPPPPPPHHHNRGRHYDF